MEQKLFDVLLENRKVDEGSSKYAMAFKNIEEGFVVPKEKMVEEDNSMEAQANRMLQELYKPILERFSEGELDYITHDLIPNEMKKFRNDKRKEQGY